jgi:hypothetical protein
MTKEGTRGQLYGSHEYKEIPRLHFAPVEMTKEGCANEQSPKVAMLPACIFIDAQAEGMRHFRRAGCQRPWGEIRFKP